MKFFYITLSIFLYFIIPPAYAQKKFTISGYLKDAANGEVLAAAAVGIKEGSAKATSNSYGFYSITLFRVRIPFITAM